MSIRTVQGSGLAQRHSAIAGKNTNGSVTDTTKPWVRNPSWLTMPTVLSTDQKFVGLIAVFPDSTFSALTASGNYTVDWGDGTVENIATTAQANHLHDYTAAALDNSNAPVTFTASTSTVNRTAHGYSDGMTVRFFDIVTTTGLTEGQFYYVINAASDTFQVSATVGGSAVTLTGDGSAALLPYKQALVTVTPQAGQNLTALNLNVKHSQTGLQKYETGWLDIKLGSPNFSTDGLVIATTSAVSNIYMNMVERVTVVNFGGTTDLSYRFYLMRELKSVNFASTAAVTTMAYMFNGCYSLQAVPLFNTASVTTMAYMFNGCYSLQAVPLFNTASVTTMNYMFSSCYSLQAVPLFNTAAVTTMNYMFSSCPSLQTVPLFNTASVTTMAQMFYYCSSLQAVPLFNTASVTTMNYMFSSCYSLQAVPLFNTAAVTTMNYMFSSCPSLQTVPLFNTAAVTNMTQMFAYCYGLQTVPLFNTAAVTNMTQMFNSCYTLQTVPLFNTAAVTTMVNMFQSCYGLQTVPALDCAAVTSSANFASMFTSDTQLARIKATGIKYTFSVASCKLSDAALNEIYTNLPTVTGQTITVTGNYGTTTDDPTIATAKGWTVTG